MYSYRYISFHSYGVKKNKSLFNKRLLHHVKIYTFYYFNTVNHQGESKINCKTGLMYSDLTWNSLNLIPYQQRNSLVTALQYFSCETAEIYSLCTQSYLIGHRKGNVHSWENSHPTKYISRWINVLPSPKLLQTTCFFHCWSPYLRCNMYLSQNVCFPLFNLFPLFAF